jgi:hypothetical protein
MDMKPMVTFILIMGFLFSGIALAQDPIIFPAKGQSQDQLEKDKMSCYQWAKNETGFDPMQTPTASAPPPQQQAGRGGAVKGAAVGAGAGALIKKDDSRSKGAATGALIGGALGAVSQSRQNRQDQQAKKQWEQQQSNEYAQKRSAYNRAFAACMEPKGYTVK